MVYILNQSNLFLKLKFKALFSIFNSFALFNNQFIAFGHFSLSFISLPKQSARHIKHKSSILTFKDNLLTAFSDEFAKYN